ncbi:baseplate protein [Bacillus phage SP-10]|uniref:baseplate protein n=1 Tax=Bacillus phage SP10 TaxID=941058 RepID=UPI0002198B70|nr:baseplate protein [Bacillus phage SP-10]BAK52968.1 phage baseplate assembly protein W [Bacillus phage SP-10]
MADFIKHALIYGESLQEISQKYLDTPDRWTDLVVINNLKYPFVVWEERTPETPKNVKTIGEIVLVPVEDDTNPLEGLHKFEIDDAYDRLLGEDLSLFEDNELVNLRGDEIGEFRATNRGDLRTVKGITNLRQSLVLRLATPLGALLHHPNYGTLLYDYVGDREDYQTQQKIKTEVERTLRSDPRVADIVMNEVSSYRGILTIQVSIAALGIDDIINLGIRLDSEGVIEWG